MLRTIAAGFAVLVVCAATTDAHAGSLNLGHKGSLAEASELFLEADHKKKDRKRRHWKHKHRKHHGRHHRHHRHHHPHHRHKHQNGGFFFSFGANGPSLHVGPVPHQHARRCHRTTTDGYFNGRYAKIGGTMCYDRAGYGYWVEGSRYLIHYY